MIPSSNAFCLTIDDDLRLIANPGLASAITNKQESYRANALADCDQATSTEINQRTEFTTEANINAILSKAFTASDS